MKNDTKLKELLLKMTIEEKIGQLQQLSSCFFTNSDISELTGPMNEMEISIEEINAAGSVLGVFGAEKIREIQKRYLENSRLKIPLLFMADVIHGYKTIFPIPLGISCSWNMNIIEESAKVTAKESSVSGINVTFSPMVDLVRDPRWGRVMEASGEDPYLNSLIARAYIRGYQGDLSKNENIAACVKHFAAYGAPEGGRDYNTVNMSERNLREYYLPAYKAAIDEGVKMVMTSFNTVDGVPASGNWWLMRKVLREEWKFDEIVISDWGAVGELIPHGVAEDGKEAAYKAITAGVDIEMMTPHYTHHLKELIEEGKIDMRLIDEAVLRILQLKMDLGLFENPFRVADKELEEKFILCDEHRDAARRAAEKSIVLLKNEGILPISKNVKSLAIIGPFADSKEILGEWVCKGRHENSISLREGVTNKIGVQKVKTAYGCSNKIEDFSEDKFQEAVNIAREADTIILAVGEHEALSGECTSRTNIGLPGVQEKLIKEILKLNKPTVIVLFNGRPLDITEISKEAPAILEVWYPGTEGGNAISNLLFGDVNPSGRLTMSFPYNVGQVPVYYNSFNTGRPKLQEDSTTGYCSKYLDTPNSPLYPFGYGLSYTGFKYSGFSIDKREMKPEDVIVAKVKVRNIGKTEGIETVQLYIRDFSGSVVRPIKELKGFKQICLKAGEEIEVSFEIDESMLRFHTLSNEFKSEEGKFIVMIGPNSNDLYELEFKLI